MKNKFFFDAKHPLFTFRWFIVIVAGLLLWEAYADYSGWRIVSAFNTGEQWSSTGTGTHARHK